MTEMIIMVKVIQHCYTPCLSTIPLTKIQNERYCFTETLGPTQPERLNITTKEGL